MDFQTSIKTCFNKYAVFSGRGSRSEFWWFFLFCCLGTVIAWIIDVMIFGYALDDFEFTMEQSEEGYKNFTVIQCKIKNMEWLYLAAKGHRRAKFDLENNKDYWLIP